MIFKTGTHLFSNIHLNITYICNLCYLYHSKNTSGLHIHPAPKKCSYGSNINENLKETSSLVFKTHIFN